MADARKHVEESNVHGDCDMCRLGGNLHRVSGGYFLCSGCTERVDSIADSLVMDADSEYDDITEAFVAVLDRELGSEIVLHFPSGDGPTDSHTHTARGVESFEIEFGEKNTVRVDFVGGESDTFSGMGLTVSGMTL